MNAIAGGFISLLDVSLAGSFTAASAARQQFNTAGAGAGASGSTAQPPQAARGPALPSTPQAGAATAQLHSPSPAASPMSDGAAEASMLPLPPMRAEAALPTEH